MGAAMNTTDLTPSHICAVCYHPKDRCSHCDASEGQVKCPACNGSGTRPSTHVDDEQPVATCGACDGSGLTLIDGDVEEAIRALRWIREFAEAHHAQEPAGVHLHHLTIDIPHYLDYVIAALDGSVSGGPPWGPTPCTCDTLDGPDPKCPHHG